MIRSSLLDETHIYNTGRARPVCTTRSPINQCWFYDCINNDSLKDIYRIKQLGSARNMFILELIAGIWFVLFNDTVLMHRYTNHQLFGRRFEMLHSMKRSTDFAYGCVASVKKNTQVERNDTCCCHIVEYSFQLTRDLLLWIILA